jgi:hypothetical protein
MIPIIDIIRRPPSVVERLIGKPEKRETFIKSDGIPAVKTYYQARKISIMYINNVADWITVFDEDSPSTTDFVISIGLYPLGDDLLKDDRFKYGGKLSYLNVYGFREVIMYINSEGKIWMLIVKALTL